MDSIKIVGPHRVIYDLIIRILGKYREKYGEPEALLIFKAEESIIVFAPNWIINRLEAELEEGAIKGISTWEKYLNRKWGDAINLL